MNLLLIDNPDGRSRGPAELFEQAGFSVTQAGPEGQALLEEGSFDLVLVEWQTVGLEPRALLGRVQETPGAPPVVMMSERPATEVVVEAMRAGAADFLDRPLEPSRLGRVVSRILGEDLRARFPEVGEGDLATGDPAPEILGVSTCIRNVKQLIRAAGRTLSPVFIQGPTGTGKELIARSIHRNSSRAAGPFVPVNCGALPEGLAESELFGAVKGAFTGAATARSGLVRAAQGGTLFLDELGEMPKDLQVKMLRVLQEKAVRSVGSTQEVPIDVRFLAATNRDPEEMVRQDKLREDLYFRLVVLKITLSPLSERPEDVLPMAESFLADLRERYGSGPEGFTATALEALQRYRWPGNVRELQNVLDLIFALGTAGRRIDLGDLPERIRQTNPQAVPSLPPAPPVAPTPAPREAPLLALRDAELEMIKRALEKSGGNKSKAAKMLGISRQALYRRIADLDG